MTLPMPLRGIRVLEFSHMVMGPSAGMILADLGASVTKIEPLSGDNTRNLRGSGTGFFPAFNRNKRSLALDVKNPRAQALIHRLVQRSDVVLENFRPGALDKLGLGAEALKALNPQLIHCSLKGFLSGPYEQRTALDEVVQMMGGLAYMTGPVGRPLRAGASVNDIMGGMFGVIAILAALRDRDRTGQGREIKSGLFENNVFLVAQHMLHAALTETPLSPMPERNAAWAVYDIFETADQKQVFIGVVSDTQWRLFCEEFRLKDLATDARLGTNSDRVDHRDLFMPRIRQIFKGMTADALIAVMERIGLPFGKVSRPDELFDDPHLNHPGAMVEVTLADGRKTRVPSLPVEFDGARPGLRLDIPGVGAHSRIIASEAGFTDEEIDALVADGVMVAPG